MSQKEYFDTVVVNDNLEQAQQELKEIVAAFLARPPFA